MEVFSWIIGGIIILLGIWALIVLFRHPKEILIDAPIAWLKEAWDRFIFSITILTLPLWLPIWFLDRHFKWGLFKNKALKLFASSTKDEDDLEYTVTKTRTLDFSTFRKFILTSNKDKETVRKSIGENLPKQSRILNDMSGSELTIFELESIGLYDFMLLIQQTQNDFGNSRNVGFAQNETLDFYGLQDMKSLNNIIGRTSEGEFFFYDLTGGDAQHLSVSDELKGRVKYKTDFYGQEVQKSRG